MPTLSGCAVGSGGVVAASAANEAASASQTRTARAVHVLFMVVLLPGAGTLLRTCSCAKARLADQSLRSDSLDGRVKPHGCLTREHERTCSSRARSSGSRGYSLLPRNVYHRCKAPSARMTAALAAMRTGGRPT